MIQTGFVTRWQTVLADLSLILFLVTALALEEEQALPRAATPAPVRPAPASDIALGVWRDVPGGTPLRDWLATQPPDAGQRVALTITYPAGSLPQALEQARALQAEMGAAGDDARVLLVEGAAPGAMVRLVQDSASGTEVAGEAALHPRSP